MVVADPLPQARRHVAQLAARAGLRVREAATPEECLVAAAGEGVVLVVCEPLLAAAGAVDLVRWLRAARPSVPVVVHTADTRAERVAALRRAGAADVIAKPGREERLLEALRRWGRGEGGP